QFLEFLDAELRELDRNFRQVVLVTSPWRNASTMPDLASIFGSVPWTGAVGLGLCYVAAVLGVYLTFRVLNFPDLTIEGSFPWGAGLAGSLLASAGWPHWAAILAAAGGGALAGAATGLLATRDR